MILSWGLPRQFLRKRSETTPNTNPIIELCDPVENSTTLTTTKGEKKEAKVEGGGVEAVKYGKSTYAMATAIRSGVVDGNVRKKPLSDDDGVIEGEYEYWLMPENPAAPGLYIARCAVSVEDTWNASDGGQWAYTMDAMKDPEHKQIEWGKVEPVVSADKKTITGITFTPNTEPTAPTESDTE